jgi:hypothetical protein
MNTLLSRLRNVYVHSDEVSLYDRLKQYKYEFNRDDWQLQCAVGYEDNNSAWWDYVQNLHSVFFSTIQTHRDLTGVDFRGHKLRGLVLSLKDQLHDNFIECEDCQEIESRDNSIWIEGTGTYVCDPCCSNNYSYHEGHDQYYHHDDYPEDDDDEDYEGIYGYDYDVTNALQTRKYKNETRLLGLEVEVERRSDCSSDIVDQVQDVMRDFALCKHDGSLNHGFEIVTAPATITIQKQKWTAFCEQGFADQLSAWNTNTCGMHIHVDRTSVTPLDIGKLLVFVNGSNNRKFIENIAGRSSAQWSQFKAKTIKDSLHRSDKYEALATHKPRTIEFRLFKGNIAKQGIMRNIEFVDSLCNFVRTVGLDKDTDSVNSLSYTNFVQYMSKSENKGQYPYLFSWLVRKGYTKGKGKNIQNESEES